MDSKEDKRVEEVLVEVKRNRNDNGVKPKSLNKILEDNVKRAHPTWKLNEGTRLEKGDNDVKGILRKGYSNNASTHSSMTNSSKKVNFKDATDGKGTQPKQMPKKGRDFSNPHKVYIIGEDDDDDDFVEPVNVKEGPVRMEVKGTTRRGVAKARGEQGNRPAKGNSVGIRTRSSPKTLCGIVEKLNLEQTIAVEHMGLGSLLDMTVNGIPERLGHFVVENFNTSTMQLQFGGNTIQVTPGTITEILGLRNVGINLSLQEADNRNKVVFRAWRKKYQGKKVTPTILVDDIKSSGLADDNFKINFMLLFVSVMGECSPQGCCLMSILQKFSSVEMISNVNWAQYVYDCLQRSKNTWKPHNYESYYTGPLTFLTLLYVTRTELVGVPVDHNAPPLCAWTFKLLRARQNAISELGSEPLRRQAYQNAMIEVEIPETVMPLNMKKDVLDMERNDVDMESNDVEMTLGVCEADVCYGEKAVDDMEDVKENVESEQNMAGDEPVNERMSDMDESDEEFESESLDYDLDMDELMKEYMRMIENKFALLHETRWDLEELIELGQQLFPYEAVFRNYEKTKRAMFRDCETEGDDSDSSGEDDPESDREDGCKGDAASFVTPQKVLQETYDIVEQRSPLSQIWLTQTTFDIIDDAVDKKHGVMPMSVDTAGKKSGDGDVEQGKKSPDNGQTVKAKDDADVDVIPSFNIGFSIFNAPA